MSGKPVEYSKKKVKIKKRKHSSSDEETDEDTRKKPRNSSTTVSKVKEEPPDVKLEWDDYELLSEKNLLPETTSKNIITLFKEECTIPFIARYRKSLIGDMSPDDLRSAKETFSEIGQLKSKIVTVLKSVDKLGQLNENLKESIVSVRTMEQLEHLYSPFKPGSKRTLAERAKELGLEPPAMDILYDKKEVDLVKYAEKLSKDVKEVENGVIHIIAAVIATDTELLNFLRELRSYVHFTIETKKSTSKNAKNIDESELSKFENYFNFSKPVKYLKPHQILAINRGENHKVLSVKIVVPEMVFNRIIDFSDKKWTNSSRNHKRQQIINEAIKDSYHRLIQPLIIREIREELKQKAEKASLEVFSKNLKHLLLSTPLKGKPILAIDPGYSNGCKLALISASGALLANNIIYPLNKANKQAETTLKSMLERNNCSLIALGNGTACRKVEEWLNSLIKRKIFHALDVKYTIVNEDGASIYSCSAEARKEFPDLDVNVIGAVSLARRIQDPLAELVKVEPKHLGVGMYQHDLKPKSLEAVLGEVVSECVSFVGIDLNTTSQCLLRRVSGLTDKRAQLIIEHREKIGLFTHRKQLMDVKGIGQKIFQQCAGFLRIGPINREENDSFYNVKGRTKLDATYIHPESYDLVEKLLKTLKLNVNCIGESNFIETVEKQLDNVIDLSAKFNTSKETIELILECLTKPICYDMRSEFKNVPLFKKNLTSINDLKIQDLLTGRVKNVTHFGCFVDIGVGTNGLIHSSHLNRFDLQIGDEVEVCVLNIDVKLKRIGLQAIKKL